MAGTGKVRDVSVKVERSEEEFKVDERGKGGSTPAGHARTSGAAISVDDLAMAAKGLENLVKLDNVAKEVSMIRLNPEILELLRNGNKEVREYSITRRGPLQQFAGSIMTKLTTGYQSIKHWLLGFYR